VITAGNEWEGSLKPLKRIPDTTHAKFVLKHADRIPLLQRACSAYGLEHDEEDKLLDLLLSADAKHLHYLTNDVLLDTFDGERLITCDCFQVPLPTPRDTNTGFRVGEVVECHFAIQGGSSLPSKEKQADLRWRISPVWSNRGISTAMDHVDLSFQPRRGPLFKESTTHIVIRLVFKEPGPLRALLRLEVRVGLTRYFQYVRLLAYCSDVAVIEWKDLEIGNVLGRGASAIVYQGVFGNEQVAVKKLLEVEQREIDMLADCQSPYIIRLVGLCVGDVCAIVTELAPHGSLFDVRETLKDWSYKHRVALDTANALAYLHGRNQVHRDVKSSNIVLFADCNNYNNNQQEQPIAKLCDFGLARVQCIDMTAAQGTPLWMAPEMLKKKRYSDRADIWSFGMIVWELMIGNVPFAERGMGDFCALVEADEMRLEIERRQGIPSHWRHLLDCCLQGKPKDRCSIDQVLVMLQEMPPTTLDRLELVGVAMEGEEDDETSTSDDVLV